MEIFYSFWNNVNDMVVNLWYYFFERHSLKMALLEYVIVDENLDSRVVYTENTGEFLTPKSKKILNCLTNENKNIKKNTSYSFVFE